MLFIGGETIEKKDINRDFINEYVFNRKREEGVFCWTGRI